MSNFQIPAIETLFTTTVMPLCMVQEYAEGFVDIRVPAFWDRSNPIIFMTIRLYFYDGSLWAANEDPSNEGSLCYRCSLTDQE